MEYKDDVSQITTSSSKGMNPKLLQYLMGYSEVATTINMYMHFDYEEAKAETGKVSEK